MISDANKATRYKTSAQNFGLKVKGQAQNYLLFAQNSLFNAR